MKNHSQLEDLRDPLRRFRLKKKGHRKYEYPYGHLTYGHLKTIFLEWRILGIRKLREAERMTWFSLGWLNFLQAIQEEERRRGYAPYSLFDYADSEKISETAFEAICGILPKMFSRRRFKKERQVEIFTAIIKEYCGFQNTDFYPPTLYYYLGAAGYKYKEGLMRYIDKTKIAP